MRSSNNENRSHLTYQQRCCIETLLNQGFSVRHIARSLAKAPSTISREISRHVIVKRTRINDCLNKKDCNRHSMCNAINCRKKCKSCNYCTKHCPDYVKVCCETMPDNNNLCNGCSKARYCSLDKRFYEAEHAQNVYKSTLTSSRNGFDLTAGELIAIDDMVSPLIRQGQSPYAVKQALGEKLPICESTLRRLISANELDVRNIDLRDMVKRKLRRKRGSNTYKKLKVIKKGREYSDYLKYIEEHDVSVWQLDCVEGKADDKGAIMTLHSPEFHLQLVFMLEEHVSRCVVEMLDKVEEALGSKLFREVFELILTDNGHEFGDIDGMESSINGDKRTMIFFCEPNRSDEKGACEENHKLLRYVIPKGTSVDGFMQSDMTLLTNHLNSYVRKSMFGKAPYDVAMKYLPEDFFILLGLEQIPRKNVILTPALLRKH